jgi:hypothetical protein
MEANGCIGTVEVMAQLTTNSQELATRNNHPEKLIGEIHMADTTNGNTNDSLSYGWDPDSEFTHVPNDARTHCTHCGESIQLEDGDWVSYAHNRAHHYVNICTHLTHD